VADGALQSWILEIGKDAVKFALGDVFGVGFEDAAEPELVEITEPLGEY
jgi:hypothetical protein